eukprot:CAMPEP_0183777694 /NCGR_PEP_ID=MMETSP0739-20130205/49634_1 /TAXON_ID=385413 /ORGANISM="Thalassiosira miniscula, Strain CCMP1093" /LENGTH=431 /DNA_ID=CAMNT_0026019881 /DNA_START=1 /DNA_END=1293 /DNA_ORIENTATION=-
MCCFENDNSENSCYEKNTMECEDHFICEEFYMEMIKEEYSPLSSGGNVGVSDTPPSSVGTTKIACSSSADIEKNLEVCCSDFECCFSKENSCYLGRKLECDKYSMCEEIFVGTGGGNEKAPTVASGSGDNSGSDTPDSVSTKKTYKTLCSTISDLQKNREACKNHCTPFECCFDYDNPCYEEHSQECDEYYLCEEFYMKEEEEEVPSGTGNDIVSDAPGSVSTKQSFKTLCSTYSDLQRNREACKIHCAPFTCCFDYENSCYSGNKLECDEYYLCEEFGSEEEYAESLAYRCSAPRLKNHAEACGKWCLPYECCFEDVDPCYLANKKECDEHIVCKSVLDPDGTFDSKSAAQPTLTVDKGLDASELQILEKACQIKQLRVNDSECKMLVKEVNVVLVKIRAVMKWKIIVVIMQYVQECLDELHNVANLDIS